jgi:hypothetical protein
LPDVEDREAGAIAGVQRALVQAMGALRCYVTLLAVEVERRGRRLLVAAALVGLGLLAVALFSVGFARYLDSQIQVAGAGPMITGGALLGVLLVIVAATWARRS